MTYGAARGELQGSLCTLLLVLPCIVALLTDQCLPTCESLRILADRSGSMFAYSRIIADPCRLRRCLLIVADQFLPTCQSSRILADLSGSMFAYLRIIADSCRLRRYTPFLLAACLYVTQTTALQPVFAAGFTTAHFDNGCHPRSSSFFCERCLGAHRI